MWLEGPWQRFAAALPDHCGLFYITFPYPGPARAVIVEYPQPLPSSPEKNVDKQREERKERKVHSRGEGLAHTLPRSPRSRPPPPPEASGLSPRTHSHPLPSLPQGESDLASDPPWYSQETLRERASLACLGRRSGPEGPSGPTTHSLS